MSDYFKKQCQYNLVELSLLARLHQEFALHNTSSVPEILLKMKSTEKRGQIDVLFHIDTPVGFYWALPEESVIVFHPDHRSPEARQTLLGPIA